ncbi:ComG operon protein 7 [Salibacterium halotolerans]|uniref:ComG operon protein 7 n=2 Tax=Salibacterium halotolerans TaxID=1884432 RepID=A0A1I5NL53_9BACI|nr:ComG operon protein 7 [Salibacterium halotolerans]
MPVLLIVCFLFASLVFVQTVIFVNEKQSVSKEEQVLQLEWLLRNGEQRWREEKGMLSEKQNQMYRFPDGYVTWEQVQLFDESIHLTLTAVTTDGHERTRSYYLEPQKAKKE